MSGHSHFSSIKHKKAITDARRGKLFSKLSRQISIAAREKGKDPVSNPALKMAVEKAKEFNMPKDKIEKAIQKGSGEAKGENLENIAVEAYGPGGVALIIEGITDNKNRGLGEIKQVLNQNGGKLVSEGAVQWMFEKKGCLTLNLQDQEETLREKAELLAIEAGAADLERQEGSIQVYSSPKNLDKVKKALEGQGLKVESSSLDWVPKESLEVSEKEKAGCQKLFEALDETETVQDIYSNLAS